MVLPQSEVEFPQTRWTLIDALREADHPHRDAALRQLADLYWPPVYAFLRRSGRSQDQAADLAQSFFAHVVLQRKLFEHADGERGRLRSLVLAALKNYLVDEHRRNASSSAMGGRQPTSYLGEDDILDDDRSSDPETIFERRWALTALQEALRRCDEHYRSTDKLMHWKAFEARAIQPSIAMTEPVPLSDLVHRLGFPNANEVSRAISQVRKRVQLVLRQVVAETIHGAAEQEAEYRHIISLLS